MSPAEFRLRVLHAGFSPIPLVGKQPILKDWQKHDGVSEIEIESWTKRYPLAVNTGILTKLVPAFDVDILDPDAAAAVEALAKERFEEIGFTPVRFGRFPKRAILFRCDQPFSKILAKLIAPDGSDGQRLELMCDGQQIVANGQHPDTGNPYTWHDGEPGDIKRAGLAYIHMEQARELVDDAVAILVAEYGYRPANMAKVKATQPNGAGRDEPASWTIDFADHDATCALAMKLLKSGMADGAVVNFLRAQVEGLPNIDPGRRERRLMEIPDMVTSARDKLDATRPPPPANSAQPKLEIFDVGNEDGNIPPRQWLLGTTYCRGYLSGLISAGGAARRPSGSCSSCPPPPTEASQGNSSSPTAGQ
jgi:Bifunctional DNA primase/polymerase, N-terminal